MRLMVQLGMLGLCWLVWSGEAYFGLERDLGDGQLAKGVAAHLSAGSVQIAINPEALPGGQVQKPQHVAAG